MNLNSGRLLQANLDALATHYGQLAPIIRAHQRPAACELPGPPATPGLRVRGRTLHSLRDPVREARRIAAASPPARTYVLCGLGLGYLAEAFLESDHQPRVLVVEPDPEMLRLACEVRDCSALWKPDRFALVLEADSRLVTGVLGEWGADSVRVIRAATGTLQNPHVWDELEAAVRHYGQRRTVNTNTIERFGTRWVRNLMRNVAQSDWTKGINALKGIADGVPALVLGAGPGLDEVLPVLGSLRSRMIIIAVDTARGLCLRHGVQPHLSVVVDPQYWNSRHLDFSPHSAEPVICELATSPRALRMLPGPHRFAASLFPLGKWVEASLGPREALGAGGSVATTAWDLARILGSNPIVLAGVDLGFPGLQTHARGALFERRAHWRSYRLEPAETAMATYLWSGEPYLTESQSGQRILSDRRMMVYRAWFSEQVPGSGCEVLRLGDGAAITGCRTASVDELLALPERSDMPDLSMVHASEGPDPDALLRAMEEGFSELAALSRQALELCEATRAATAPPDAAAKDRVRDAGQKELDAIDQRLQSHPLLRAAGFLFHRHASGLLDAEPPSDLETALLRSAELYRGIMQSSQTQATWARTERLKSGSRRADAPIDRTD